MDNDIQVGRIERIKQHRFVLMIGGTIGISLLLVLVSLALYTSSGTAQLDLSRPGYAGIRKQLEKDEKFKAFSADGDLTPADLKEFDGVYAQKLKEAQAVDAFGNDVLSAQSLQIDKESVSQP